VADRPHVLLVVLDAARRDAVAPYAPEVSTPVIAALAARGVAVEHARATAPWTLPSHIAMFTGALASEFGLDQAPGGDPRSVAVAVAPLADRMLATRLAAAGYDTHGYSANLWVSPHSGLDAGFGAFRYAPSARADRAFAASGGGRQTSLAWAREGWRSRGDDGAAAIGGDLRAAIRAADPATPQFFFVNLVEAHSPYLPPRPFNDLGPSDRVGAALDCERFLNFEAICVAAAGGLVGPPAALERLAHLHRRSVAYMDAWLAGVLASLEGAAMLEDTLVIITSDHGECFGEDGLLAHGFSLAEPLIHVPLIAAGPGSERFARGDGALSLRELPGLIGAAAGLEDGAFGPAGDGVAVARAGAITTSEDPRMVSFAERWSLSPAQVRRLTADRWSASDGVATLALTAGTLELAGAGVAGGSFGAGAPGGGADPPAHLLAALERARGMGDGASGPAGAADPAAALAPGVTPIPTDAPAGSAATEAEQDAVAALERQMKLLGYM
jgi:hypothetical protein